ncbi:AbrB family transcriptional regulator [Plasticicumulans lactativorans]|uniref:AbrB family transcriptional regulator n=1 Tax=Plasticicumulans lactativorans TaxID=1133106 RepID=A0A4R2L5P6_9GAMM|nr:AbrB/MazE/SpoVT family DNA-binding domain-containing protein [Plasticicumulans lactativorans]TCO81762.1 AbrB family transcriptional regulator [Plasticicumulans lactativorans]
MTDVLVTRLSSKGQLVIPQTVRERLGWSAGLELEIEVAEQGVTIRPHRAPARHGIDRLRGSIRYAGPPLSDAELQAPVTLDEAEDR